ncbi:thiopeptide-type bacteriocin biosynthesis protein [Nocardiopsis sp. EMB25]|uniref:thiopeptide-type bacteriocin biosynthesis protein n=1 Tax=Nocardiopsis sp. EMB25 TaxID=2835867 RepID=UPI00228332DA|nr:thiopeptide-type bacteriocin biosynthesis protein [Nocardiopsis sp. EMB25]MCY9785201.1 thiopeptide-type bacteriocin biosynthesis protein [Nocardiopsis sp. EMB25]
MTHTSDTWLQATVSFPDPATAEHVSIRHLAAALDGLTWFFVRKGAWRCRIRLPEDAEKQETTQERVAGQLDELATTGTIRSWTQAVYEPETRTFGGETAIDTAHTLFCADTHHTMRFLATTRSGRDRRREVSLLLCRALMRAAGLDHYEQGDVWHRVAATRPLPSDGPHPTEEFHHQVHRLLSVDPGPGAVHFTTGAFAGFAPWARGFQACGQELAALHAQGRLKRGLRAILAHHILFHWNRLGIPGPQQAVLSHTAARVIFDPETVGI